MNAFQNTTGPSIWSRERKTARVIDLAPRKFHVYSAAEADRESTIKRLTAEIAAAHESAKNYADMATFQRSRARAKAKQVRDLVASRG